MSKSSNHAKLECLKLWRKTLKTKIKKKKEMDFEKNNENEWGYN
jgi:hypothetical protein